MSARRNTGPQAAEALDGVTAAFDGWTKAKSVRNANEATTRVELIDRVLTAVGWTSESIEREVPTKTGKFLDYELRVSRDPWMVIEAKRVGKTFWLEDPGGTHRQSMIRSLRPMLSRAGQEFRDVATQAANYCNDRGIPLACITNGQQWIFFRGLSSRNRPWTTGAVVAFVNGSDVLERFDDFFGCIAIRAAGTSYLPRLLDRTSRVEVPAALVPRDLIETRRAHPDPGRIAVRRSVCDYLLADIYGDGRGEMLDRCYIEPGVKGDFERSIQRLLKDTSRAIEAEHVIDGDTSTFVEQLQKADRLVQARTPIVVVGHVGAGKSTFLQRTLSRMREESESFYALVDLEGYGHAGFDAAAEEQRVAKAIVEKLGRAASTVLRHRGDLSDAAQLEADPDSSVTIKTLFRKEIEAEKDLGRDLWVAKPDAWVAREYELLSDAKRDRVEFLLRFLRHVRGRFKRLEGKPYPVLIVLDNLDQATDDYQRCVYGLAQRIARQTSTLVVLCLREDTYVRGQQSGGFLTSSALQFVFHVASPPLDRVIRERVKFGRHGLEHDAIPAARGLSGERGEVEAVLSLLQSTLLVSPSEARELIAGLSGHNTREALGVARAMVLGATQFTSQPNSSAAFAFDCILAGASTSVGSGRDLQLANCFDADPAPAPAHALRLRLLSYFSYAFEHDSERLSLEHTDALLARFSAWGYSVSQTELALRELLRRGLLRPSNRSEAAPLEEIVDLPARMTITAPGHVHLTRLAALPAYRAAMGLTTRWYDQEMCRRFADLAHAAGNDDGPTIADVVASRALAVFDSYLAKAAASEDAALAGAYAQREWVSNVVARVPSFTSPQPSVDGPPQPPARKFEPRTRDSESQLVIGGVERPVRRATDLATLPRELEYSGTVWIPRILWALEYARRNDAPKQSASDLSRLLREHGDVDVPNTNVARAFRELRASRKAAGLWTSAGKRYEITDAGTKLLLSFLDAEG